jgi:hypothetical protein|nr:hypothetical protein [Kofleriaceae bacterium]
MRALALMCWLAGTAGCLHAIPPLPSQGGPAWHELVSPHFTMWTDASEDRGRALLVRMEHHRQRVLRVLGDPPTTGSIFVIALRDQPEINAFIPVQFAAEAFDATNPSRQSAIVVAADIGENPEHDRILTHELTHAITFTFLPHQPHWLAEGLADYFATIRVFPSHDGFDLGTPIRERVRDLAAMRPLPLAQLMACPGGACMDARFYATAYALFTFLITTHRAELFALLDKLPDGSTAPILALEPEFLQWIAYGQVAVSQFDLRLVDPTVTAGRALTDADALAARALLDQGRGPELAQAIAKDPTNLLARLVQIATGAPGPLSAADARATAAAHADDWRAWYLVVRVAPGDRDAREHMCARSPADREIQEYCAAARGR